MLLHRFVQLATLASSMALTFCLVNRNASANVPVHEVRLERNARDASANHLDCYRIEVHNATYYLDKVGAGLSSMVDADGNDWIGFHPRKGSGAAGEYRGFPNAVFQEAGSYFHARNAGTDPCVTMVEQETVDRIVISALSSNGKWAGRYTFTPDGLTFTMTKKPNGHNYWVLYEGTPGGTYDDSDWWMTSAGPDKNALTTPHEGDISSPNNPEWIAFGDQASPRSLLLVHHENDQATDRFYQMERKMTVFGFGRSGMTKSLNSVPQSFSICFVETTDHAAVAKQATILADQPSQSTTPQTHYPLAQRKAFEQFALTADGDAQAGQKLFSDDLRTRCATCHKVDKQGGQVGPDLSKIGGKFDRPHLIEALLAPSKQIVEGYQTTVIVTKSGEVKLGIVKAEDEHSVTLLSQHAKLHTLPVEDIEERQVTNISLMPTGLADQLSPQEFTDLLAYLETLRTDKASFGSGVTGPLKVPEGFEVTTVATGLSGATAMDISSDGRIFIGEQHGALRVVRNGQLQNTPVLSIPVEHNWERGLIGVSLAPSFPNDPHIYVVYVTDQPYSHHRVSRFRAAGNVADPTTEQILLRGDDQSQFGGFAPAGHQGGGIHFGNDGKLYIGLGEQTAKTPSQRFDALQGKILRINPDGTIPEDNPFLEQTVGKYQAIWAMGCRNPFTFAVRSTTGEILINDVGGKFEEINRGLAGANYGWPTADHGHGSQDGLTGSIHRYPEASISGGDFSDVAKNWPAKYQGKYFFADFVHGWIKFLDLNEPAQAQAFAQGLRRIVDLRFAPNGDLYALLRNAWIVDDKFEGGTGSLVRIRPIANAS